MDDEKPEKYTYLDGIYHDVTSPASFSSIKKLHAAARNNGRKDISLKDVKNYLATQTSYTMHGYVPRTYRKSMVIVNAPGKLLSSDLADFSNLKDDNNGYRYLVFFIDCFSRKLNITPIKDKKSQTLALVLDHYLTHDTTYKYSRLWVDRGGEYYNKSVQKILEKHGIKMYSVHNYRVKASYSERVIKTIKIKLYKMFTQFNSYNYIKHLDNVVEAYNNSKHTGLLGMTPNQVHKITDEVALTDLTKKMVNQKYSNYGGIKRGRWQLDLSVRDIIPVNTHVRLLGINADNIFNKSYQALYTDVVFEVDSVNLNTNPITYTLRDLNGEKIEGRIYRNELKIAAKPNLYDIERVIQKKYCRKTKKHLALVKYIGYPDSFNEWVDIKNLVDI